MTGVADPTAHSLHASRRDRPYQRTADEVCQRLDRLMRHVDVGARLQASEVDAVIRDAKALLVEGGLPTWKLAEIHQDVRTLARFGSPPPARVPEPGDRQRPRRRQTAVPSGETLTRLLESARRLVARVEAGEQVDLETFRSMKNAVQVAERAAVSRRDPMVHSVTAVYRQMTRAQRMVKARSTSRVDVGDHRRSRGSSVWPQFSVDAPVAPQRARENSVPRPRRSTSETVAGSKHHQKQRRALEREAGKLRDEAERLTRALEQGRSVPSSQITDLLYRFAARSMGMNAAADFPNWEAKRALKEAARNALRRPRRS